MPKLTKSRSKKIKHLNLNPLSVVKFFYERMGEKALEQPFIQPALYLTEYEAEKKLGLSFFREKFQV